MSKKTSQPPVILPARMSLQPNAFDDLEIAVLDLPYQKAIQTFMSELRRLIGTVKMWHYPSYRLLNNAIAACAPTVVHGFESYGSYPNKGRRMLAVGSISGKPSLQYPSEQRVAHLVRVWINCWGKSSALKRHIVGKAKDIWQALEAAIDQPPDTHWTKVSPELLMANLNAEEGLAFQAIPSLLATLLHDKTSVVGEEKREIKWRRSQDDNNSLCVVSDPLSISFEKQKYQSSETETKEGFFTYKLEFRLHTQTGRKDPWIHVFLRCQRYAFKPLRSNKRGHNITILAGMNQSRIKGWDRDTTLVRLKARSSPSEQYAGWIEDLPSLLEDMNARSLTNPYEIYRDPQAFWRSDRTESLQRPDEYYIPHVEGYKYPNRGNHSVATGFGLAERSEIIEQTCCTLLGNVLKPDDPLDPDVVFFHPKQQPLVLQTFSDLSESPKIMDEKQAAKKGLGTSIEERQQYKVEANVQQRKERQHIPKNAISRALRSDTHQLNILIVYQRESTQKAIYQQIREALLLNEKDSLPHNVTIQLCPIVATDLLTPLETDGLSPNTRHLSKSQQPANFEEDWNKQIRRSHHTRMNDWRALLGSLKAENATTKPIYVAFIELSEESPDHRKFHESQSPKGAIREACAREHMLSQMVFPVKKTEKEVNELKGKDKGRIQNAVQDLINRQLGTLYGEPKEIYQKIGLSTEVGQNLDLIAFCIAETNLDINYCCAVRLSASGEVDVRLPKYDTWIPYSEAGWHLGKIFAEGRKASSPKKKPDKKPNPIKLSAIELIDFVEETLTTHIRQPTIALIKAKKWRNRSKKSNGWAQLTTGGLANNLDRLYFNQDKANSAQPYDRNDNRLYNLLGVIRIRTGDETPQYITNRNSWEDDSLSRDLAHLSGFTEFTEDNVFHYFSVGRLPDTVKRPQSIKKTEDPYKSETGGGVAFKHQQMVEMVPFYVRSDFRGEEGLKALCRAPHHLRSSPGWSMGNIVLPYPMHLGDQLIKDQLCILPDG